MYEDLPIFFGIPLLLRAAIFTAPLFTAQSELSWQILALTVLSDPIDPIINWHINWRHLFGPGAVAPYAERFLEVQMAISKMIFAAAVTLIASSQATAMTKFEFQVNMNAGFSIAEELQSCADADCRIQKATSALELIDGVRLASHEMLNQRMEELNNVSALALFKMAFDLETAGIKLQNIVIKNCSTTLGGITLHTNKSCDAEARVNLLTMTIGFLRGDLELMRKADISLR
jgi:hypothetical protein